MSVNRVLLRNKRLEKHLTLKDMSKVIGGTQSAYGNKEYGLRKFNENDIPKVCQALGITTDEFFGLD